MSEPVASPLRWLALIALDRPELPSFEDVAHAMSDCFQDAPPMTASTGTDHLLTCTMGDDTVAATLIDRPIAREQLEGPCATAWYWPEAAETLREHEAHLLVTLVDEGGSPIEKCRRLTQWVTALVASSSAQGIFWGTGRLVHPVQAFIEQAIQMTQTDLPLFLWIDFRIEQIEEGQFRLYTTGLDSLGYPELEVREYDGVPQTLLEFVYNLAHYQISQSKTIHDGDTLGMTEEVQVIARQEKSMWDDQIDVLRLEFEEPLS